MDGLLGSTPAGVQLGLGVISNMADQCREWVCEYSFLMIMGKKNEWEHVKILITKKEFLKEKVTRTFLVAVGHVSLTSTGFCGSKMR